MRTSILSAVVLMGCGTSGTDTGAPPLTDAATPPLPTDASAPPLDKPRTPPLTDAATPPQPSCAPEHIMLLPATGESHQRWISLNGSGYAVATIYARDTMVATPSPTVRVARYALDGTMFGPVPVEIDASDSEYALAAGDEDWLESLSQFGPRPNQYGPRPGTVNYSLYSVGERGSKRVLADWLNHHSLVPFYELADHQYYVVAVRDAAACTGTVEVAVYPINSDQRGDALLSRCVSLRGPKVVGARKVGETVGVLVEVDAIGGGRTSVLAGFTRTSPGAVFTTPIAPAGTNAVAAGVEQVGGNFFVAWNDGSRHHLTAIDQKGAVVRTIDYEPVTKEPLVRVWKGGLVTVAETIENGSRRVSLNTRSAQLEVIKSLTVILDNRVELMAEGISERNGRLAILESTRMFPGDGGRVLLVKCP